MRLGLLLLVLVASTVRGDLGPEYELTFVNTTGSKIRLRRVEATLGDATHGGSSLVLHTDDVTSTTTVLSPLYSYNALHVGFLTTHVEIFRSQVYEVRQLLRLGDTNSVEIVAPKRRLLSTGEAIDAIRTDIGRKLLSFDLAQVRRTACASIVGFVMPEGACDTDTGGFSKKTIESMQNQIDRFEEWQTSVTDFTGKSQANFANINKTLFAVTRELEILQQGIDIQANATATLEAIARATTYRVDENARIAQKKFETLSAHIEDGIVYATDQSRSELLSFVTTTTSNFKRRDAAIGSIINSTVDNNRLYQRKFRDGVRLTRRVAAAVTKSIDDKDVEFALTADVWASVDRALSMGLVPFFHPDFNGSRPVTVIPEAVRVTYVDHSLYRFMTDDSGIIHANAIEVAFMCDRDDMAKLETLDVDFHEFSEMLGPSGCVARATASGLQTADNCSCWKVVTKSTCVPKAGFSFTAINTDVRTFPALRLTQASCQGPLSTTITTIDNVLDWYAVLSGICASKTPISARNINLASLRVNEAWTVLPSTSCAIDSSTTFETEETGNSLPWATYQSWILAWNIMQQDNDLYSLYRRGSLPNLLDTVYLPFQTREDGDHYRANRILFAAMAPTQVPIYLLTFEGIESRITTETISDTTGLLVLDTVTQSTPLPIVATDRQLPQSDFLVFGDLSSDMSTFYDVPVSMQTLAPEPTSREGKITYAMCPVPPKYNILTATSDPPTCNMKTWLTQNQFNFHHIKAAASLHRYLRVLDPTTGRVVGTVLNGSSPLSTLFNLGWGLHSSTNIRQGKVVFTPSVYQYPKITIDIVRKGAIVQDIASGCPTTKYIGFSDRSGGQVVLYNPWDFSINLVIKRMSDSPQCPGVGNIQLVLTGKQEWTKDVPICRNYTLTVYRVDASEGLPLVSCGSSMNITLNPESSGNIDPAIIGSSNVTIITNRVIQELNDISGDALLLLLQAFAFTRGIQDITIDQMRALNNSARQALLDRFRREDAKENLTAITLGHEVGVLFNDLAKLRQDAANQKAASAAVITELKADNAELSALVNASAISQAKVAATSVKLTAANLQLWLDLEDEKNKTRTGSIIIYVIIALIGIICICGCLLYFCAGRGGGSGGGSAPLIINTAARLAGGGGTSGHYYAGAKHMGDGSFRFET